MNPEEQGGQPSQEQMQQILQQIAQMLQQGEDPNAILQQLVEANIPQEQAQQMIQAVMEQMQGGEEGAGAPATAQSGSQYQGAGAGGQGQEAMAVLQEAIQVLQPQGLAMVLQAWDSLPQEQKQQMIQQLSQMAGEQQQGQDAQANAPQDNRSAMLFGEGQ